MDLPGSLTTDQHDTHTVYIYRYRYIYIYIYIYIIHIYYIAHESNHLISYNHMVCVLYIYTYLYLYLGYVISSYTLRAFCRYVKLILMLVSWLTPKQILPLRLRSWIVATWRMGRKLWEFLSYGGIPWPEGFVDATSRIAARAIQV